LSIKLIGDKKLIKNLQLVAGKYERETGQALRRQAFRIENKSKKNLRDSGHNNTGRLINSAYVTHFIKIFNKLVVETGYFAEYAPAIHEGTPPHYVPVDKLKVWAREKFSASDDDAEDIAYAVQNKIEWVGTRGSKFFENAIDDLSDSIIREIRDYVKAQMERGGLK